MINHDDQQDFTIPDDCGLSIIEAGPANISLISDITVYRGAKGSLHRSHHKPRAIAALEWFEVFTNKVCGGDISRAQEMIEEFHGLDSNPETHLMADGIIKTLINLKCSEDCLRCVLRIGATRYNRIKLGLAPRKPSGINNRAVGADELAHLLDFVTYIAISTSIPVVRLYLWQ